MISREEALGLYRKLLLARLSEEKIRDLYPSDEIKSPVHLGIGEEAIPVGVCHALPQGAKCFGTYRNHTLYLALTEDTDGFFAELYGKATGCGKGKAGSMHLMAPEAGLMATSAVVATTIPLAVGAALAHQYQGTPRVTASFFGDGAMEEGVFWESLNFACLHRLPVLFVCEDNGLAIHAHPSTRRGFPSVVEAARGFDCHRLSEKGNDVVLVAQRAREILSKMAETPKPGFLHLTWHRFLEHVGPNEDFGAGYRERPSSTESQEADPIRQFQARLASYGCSEVDAQAVETAVREKIDASVAKARGAPFPDSTELLKDVLV